MKRSLKGFGLLFFGIACFGFGLVLGKYYPSEFPAIASCHLDYVDLQRDGEGWRSRDSKRVEIPTTNDLVGPESLYLDADKIVFGSISYEVTSIDDAVIRAKEIDGGEGQRLIVDRISGEVIQYVDVPESERPNVSDAFEIDWEPEEFRYRYVCDPARSKF